MAQLFTFTLKVHVLSTKELLLPNGLANNYSSVCVYMIMYIV